VYICTFLKKYCIVETRLKIQKWGNDLGINIPEVIANGLSLKEGLYVNLYDKGSRIIIEPVKTNVSYCLNDMLSEITEDNIHHCIDSGMPTGNEIW